jgi:hypothetical protein
MKKMDYASPSQPYSTFCGTGGEGSGYVVLRHSVSEIELRADANKNEDARATVDLIVVRRQRR